MQNLTHCFVLLYRIKFIAVDVKCVAMSSNLMHVFHTCTQPCVRMSCYVLYSRRPKTLSCADFLFTLSDAFMRFYQHCIQKFNYCLTFNKAKDIMDCISNVSKQNHKKYICN